MSEEANISQEGKDIQNAAISGTGDATVTIIHNYYYSKDISAGPVDPVVVSSDEVLPCPYRGLYHFDIKDADFYFGREVFVEELFKATQIRNFIPVIGASGSGKSSVVLAGLVPKLQQEGHWLFTYFRPGADPFYNLASALISLYTSVELNDTDRMLQASTLADSFRDEKISLSKVFVEIQQKHPKDRVLLIADQFEEVYTLCTDELIRHRFLDLLELSIKTPHFQSSSPMVLVSTMRADFLGNALAYRPFADLFGNDIKIGSMNREELRAVIEKPPAKLEVTFQDGLVECILDDVKDEPGNLPLLELALTSLWEKRKGKQLNHGDYKEIGRVQGALNSYAEYHYSQFTEDEKPQIQRIFIQLVRTDEDAGYIRRLATRDDIGEENWDLVIRLATQRLVVTSQNDISKEKTVELVHEALIREWKRLHQWMIENRDFRAWQERLRTSIRQWESAEQDKDSLLRGLPLAESENWLNTRNEELSEDDRNFIQESIKSRKEGEDKEKQRLNEKARLQRRFNIGLIAFSALVSVVAIVAFRQQKAAEAQELGVTALNNFESGYGEIDALALAMEAGQKLKIPFLSNIECFQECLATSPILALQKILDNMHQTNQNDTYQIGVNSIRFIENDSQIAAARKNGKITWWDIKGNLKPREQSLYPQETSITSLDFNKDESQLLTGTSDGSIGLWAISKNKPKTLGRIVTMHHACKELKKNEVSTNNDKCKVNNVRFIPSSNLIATTGEDGNLRIWNLNGKLILPPIKADNKGSIKSLSPSPNGLLLATAGEDGTVKLWHLKGNLKKPEVFKGHGCSKNQEQVSHKDCSVNSVWFHPGGNQLVTAGDDGTVRQWDLKGKQIRKEFQAHQEGVETVRMSPNGQNLATAGKNGQVKLWDFNGKLKAEFNGHQGSVISLRFNKASNALATAGKDDGTVRFWKVSDKSSDNSIKLKGYEGLAKQSVESVRFSPESEQLATAGDDDMVRIWDTKKLGLGEKQIAKKFRTGQKGINSIRFQPQPTQPKSKGLIATGGKDGTIVLWKRSGIRLATLSNPNVQFKRGSQAVRSITFNSKGNELFSSSDDGMAVQWKLDGKKLKEFPVQSQGKVVSIRLSQNDNMLATVGENGAAVLWNIDSKDKKVLNGNKGNVNTVSIMRQEDKLAIAGDERVVRLWDFSGQKLDEFKTYHGRITQINFSWDDKLLSVSSDDNKVRLLNLSGQQLAEFTGHQGNIKSADFSRDGKLLATASADGTAIVWPIRRLDQLLNEGCLRLKDYFATHPEEQKKLPLCHEKTSYRGQKLQQKSGKSGKPLQDDPTRSQGH
jgi:WD40 repeat protein